MAELTHPYQHQPLRLYTFVHAYMSPIQHGIQTAHIVGDLLTMSAHTPRQRTQHQIAYDWATDHKTIIVLNGGNSQSLLNILDVLSTMSNALSLPCVSFYEDGVSMELMRTAVGIVVPESIYTLSRLPRGDDDCGGDARLTPSTEAQLSDFLSTFRLA